VPLKILIVLTLLSLMTMSVGATSAFGNDRSRTPDLHDLALRATGDNPSAAKEAITQLRAAGPAGLAALIDANADAVRQHRAGVNAPSADQAPWPRVSAAIDAVAAQKDAWASGLYWYTDLEAAKKAARESGKPILSLRMLGTLDTDYSCANSRFFRTVLYSNAEVSKVLSERFVLHWKSVRPVPKVTIDFGDGRVVQRTITGNSIHYVLDAEGRVIDGIPGLYGPKPFLREMNEASSIAPGRSVETVAQFLQRWHVSKNNQILGQWQQDLRQVGVTDGTLLAQAAPQQAALVQRAGPAKANPSAVAAAPRAIGKAVVEMRLVTAISPNPQAVELADKEQVWNKIAALHADEANLDSVSLAVMASKNPTALQAGKLARSKAFVENPLAKMIRNFQQSVAMDSVRNEYLFHRQIHAWLAEGKLPDGKSAIDVDALNERVYADLFLTPSSDPWLGLLPADTYSALPDDGLCPMK
jgi:hypothetical protein